MDFYKAVSEKRSIIHDFSPDSKVLLIFFGGIYGGLGGVPVYEFLNITNTMNAKKIFIRDLKQAWYQLGIYSETAIDHKEGVHDVESLEKLLSKKISEADVEKVIMIGNSAGGFASLLFGNMLNVHSVHAFSPQTFIDLKNRENFSDDRFQDYISSIYNKIRNPFYYDLLNVIRKCKSTTKCNIYFDETDRIDKVHATRMKEFGNVQLHKFQQGGHSLIKHLKDSEQLHTILSSLLL